MLAGETWVILAAARVSTKLRDTLDDSAPMTTDGFAATMVPAEPVEIDMSVESPESRTLWQALAPLTPPAALMSETARPTPATAGGPEEGEVAGQRQDAADVERVGAAGPSRALVVRERGCGLRRGLLGRGCGARALVVAGVCSGVAVVAARDQGQTQGSAQSDRGRQPPEPPGGGGGSIHVVNLSSRECTSPRPGSPEHDRAQHGHRNLSRDGRASANTLVSEPLRQCATRART